MKKWIAKIIGFILRRKLNLKEDHEMTDKKKWYQSKSVWTALTVFLIGAYELADTQLGPVFKFDLPAIPGWIFSLLGAIGVYSRVVAKKEIK